MWVPAGWSNRVTKVKGHAKILARPLLQPVATTILKNSRVGTDKDVRLEHVYKKNM